MIDITVDATGTVHVHFIDGGPSAHFVSGKIQKWDNGTYYGAPFGNPGVFLTSLNMTVEGAAKALVRMNVSGPVRNFNCAFDLKNQGA